MRSAGVQFVEVETVEELEVGAAMLKDDEVDVLVQRIGEVLAPRG